MQFSAFFSYILLYIELKFFIWFCFTVLQIKFVFCQFPLVFVGVMPLLELRILKIHHFPHFSLTSFDRLNWNFAYDFILLYYRSNLILVDLRQFWWELCPFWNLEYWKYAVFRLFSYLLWHIELKFCIWLCFTVLQIKFGCHQFASNFLGVMPLLELRVVEIHSIPHFSLTFFDILSRNFAYGFVLLYYRSSASFVNSHKFL